MKNILLIGGSRGIGAATLNNLLIDNHVTNISRSEPNVQHERLKHYGLDITKDALPDIDDLDALIYCPGSINLKPISSLKEDDFYNDFNINVIGAVKSIKHYLKALKNNNGGAIVLFSTVAVAQGMPFHSSVAVSKAGVEALTKSLAAELAPKIRVNCVAPSITDTPLAAGILRNDKSREKLIQKHPLKKILVAEDVAHMVTFLTSDKSSGISGQIMAVDAGLSNLRI